MTDKPVFRPWGKSVASSPHEPIQAEPVHSESVPPEPIRIEPVQRESIPLESVQIEPVQSRPRAKRTPRPVQPEPIQITNGYWQLPNTVMDDILPTLQKDDQLVYLRLLRLTWGHRRPTCDVTTAKLGEKTGVKRTAMFAAITRLEARGLVRRVAAKLTGPLDERWNTYEAFIPGVDPPWEKGSPSKPNASSGRTDAPAEHMKGNPKDNVKDGIRLMAVRVVTAAMERGEGKLTAIEVERRIRDALAVTGGDYSDVEIIAAARQYGREGDS